MQKPFPLRKTQPIDFCCFSTLPVVETINWETTHWKHIRNNRKARPATTRNRPPGPGLRGRPSTRPAPARDTVPWRPTWDGEPRTPYEVTNRWGTTNRGPNHDQPWGVQRTGAEQVHLTERMGVEQCWRGAFHGSPANNRGIQLTTVGQGYEQKQGVYPAHHAESDQRMYYPTYKPTKERMYSTIVTLKDHW